MIVVRGRVGRRRSWWRQLLVSTLVIISSVLVAGCGSPSRPAALNTFCGRIPALTGLSVTRSTGPQSNYTFDFPAQASSSDVPAVRQLARTICRLAPQRDGVFHCPADFGIDYQLRFLAARQELGSLQIDPSGCSVLKGLGAVLVPVSSFWDQLAGILHVAPLRVNCDPFLGSAPGNYPSNCGANL